MQGGNRTEVGVPRTTGNGAEMTPRVEGKPANHIQPAGHLLTPHGAFSPLLHLALGQGGCPVFMDPRPLAVQWDWPVGSTYRRQGRRAVGYLSHWLCLGVPVGRDPRQETSAPRRHFTPRSCSMPVSEA